MENQQVFLVLPTSDLTQPILVVAANLGAIDGDRISVSGKERWWYKLGESAFWSREEALEQVVKILQSRVNHLEGFRREVSDSVKRFCTP